MEAKRLTVEQIRRRSATMGLMVAASLNVQDIVGMSSLPVAGSRQERLADIRGEVSAPT